MSKFKDILKAAKEREGDNIEISSTQALGAVEVEETAPEPIRPEPQSDSSETQPPKRGRPKGKRSDPDYEQVTAYIKKETYRQSKIALLQQGEVQDFSLLVEQLLSEWLSTQNSKNLNS
jgi:hypothetical protein